MCFSVLRLCIAHSVAGTGHTVLLHTIEGGQLLPLSNPFSRCDCVRILKSTSNPSSLAVIISSALLHAGHKISRSHALAGSLKTTASREEVHDIFRSWIKSHPVKVENISDRSPAVQLLAKEAKSLHLLPRILSVY